MAASPLFGGHRGPSRSAGTCPSSVVCPGRPAPMMGQGAYPLLYRDERAREELSVIRVVVVDDEAHAIQMYRDCLKATSIDFLHRPAAEVFNDLDELRREVFSDIEAHRHHLRYDREVACSAGYDVGCARPCVPAIPRRTPMHQPPLRPPLAPHRPTHPWVATHGISTSWLRHTTLTWVERRFGYGIARAYTGHTDTTGPATTTSIKANLHDIATAPSTSDTHTRSPATTIRGPRTRHMPTRPLLSDQRGRHGTRNAHGHADARLGITHAGDQADQARSEITD
jgi:hypothetical protein